MGQVQNEEHLCLIAVIGVERPDNNPPEDVEKQRERRSGDSRAWTERTQRVRSEATMRVEEKEDAQSVQTV